MSRLNVAMRLNVVMRRLGVCAIAGCALALACIPVDAPNGGTIPPPPITADPPAGGDNGGGESGGDGSGGGGDTGVTVFDINVQATSLEIADISIAATLTLTASDGNSEIPFSDVTIQDTINDFTDTTGFSGGLLLTTEPASPLSSGSRFFRLVTDGDILRVESQPGSGENPNRFILQSTGTLFDPTILGISYNTEPGSFFTIEINGDSVMGEINLNGIPFNESADTNTYIGTYSGTRR